MSISAANVLIVEDDAHLADALGDYLKSEGFDVAIESDSAKAVERIRVEQPDIVILDIMLPKIDGLEVCRLVRPFYSGAILMLTGKIDEGDQIQGLEAGADDYVLKPVHPSLLLARVRALLRRVESRGFPAIPGGEIIEMGGEVSLTQIGCLLLNQSAREAYIGSTTIDLTTIEFDLLWLLVQQAGQPVDRDSLYRDLLNREYDGLDRTIDVHISKLRRKLVDQGGCASWIKTVHGRGYQLFVETV